MESTDLHKLHKSTEQNAKRAIWKQIVWQYTLAYFLLHLTALYGLYVSLTSAKLLTWVYGKLKTYTLLICIFLVVVG